MVLTIVYNTLGLWTLAGIINNWKTQHIGNPVCFSLQVGGGSHLPC
jgi:hypothetical protein